MYMILLPVFSVTFTFLIIEFWLQTPWPQQSLPVYTSWHQSATHRRVKVIDDQASFTGIFN